MDSEALTKIQSLALVAIIVVAAASGVAAYYLWSGTAPSSETIKIGIFADLDMPIGKNIWQAATLAAEQLNEEGGILGRRVEIIGEDNDVDTGLDIVKASSALTRLITYHKVDFIMGTAFNEIGAIVAEHKKIFLAASGQDALIQRVLDDYDNYKYFFVHNWNNTAGLRMNVDSFQLLSEITDFTKVAILAEDREWAKVTMDGLDQVLPELYGYSIVYKGTFPLGTVDFSSYFAQAEAAGAEILIPFSVGGEALVIAKEYHDRQSPMVIYGGFIGAVAAPESWQWTDGKCEYISVTQLPLVAGYPITSKTLPTRDAYIERWGKTPEFPAGMAFDLLRFILPDAIKRAGSIETEAVIRALEETSIETSSAQNFVFTSSHDAMMDENPYDPEAGNMMMMWFQWQNGEMVPVYPKKMMEESGSTFTFPPWTGPWTR